MRSLLLLVCAHATLSLPVNITISQADMGIAFGVDLVEQVPTSTFQCFKDSNFLLATVRAYNPGGQGYYDPNGGINIKNGGGIMPMEVYMWPQPFSTKQGGQQFQEMFDGLKNDGITLKSAWLQVTLISPNTGQKQWGPSVAQNIAFISAVLMKMRTLGVRPGIFTNPSDWRTITGNWPDHGSDVMLWYAAFNSWGLQGETSPSMSGFQPFGGFYIPYEKMYGAGEMLCGVVVDKDSFTLTQSILTAIQTPTPNIAGGYIGSQ